MSQTTATPIDPEVLSFVAGLDADTAASVILIDPEAARRNWDQWSPEKRAEVFLRDMPEVRSTGNKKDLAEMLGGEEHVREQVARREEPLPEDHDPEVIRAAAPIAAYALRTIIDALLPSRTESATSFETVTDEAGRRLLVMAWLIGCPALAGVPLAELGRRLGECRAATSLRAKRLRDALKLGQFSSLLRGEKAVERSRQAALRYWASGKRKDIDAEANRKRSEAMAGVPHAAKGERRKDVVQDEQHPSQDRAKGRAARAKEANVSTATQARVEALASCNP
ncbi:MAG: hypothetical protein FGM15_07080 [Chthoniobacterales bacterium]|nr:hypothetical protein [Chthoniobacterales bacterium]